VRILLILAAALVLNASEPEALWLDVPFVKQQAGGCGAASLAMLLDYWQLHGAQAAHPDAASIQRALYVPAERGILASAMKDYLSDRGFRVFTFGGEWSDLQHHIADGRPLVVALKTGQESLHYVVVAGIGNSTVVLNDPSDRKLRKYDRDEFEKRWRAASGWTLLAVPRLNE
jgi:predicted double-glycine peptidase